MATHAALKQEDILAMEPELPPLRKQLVEMVFDPDKAFDMPEAELNRLRLKAAQELFLTRREQIPLLRKRAEDAKIESIKSFDDLVPLLFAHTVYKSYPKQLLDNGRWEALRQWLQSLSVSNLSNVDLSNIKDIDDWIQRFWDAGHSLVCTSGSSGKVSFLVQTMADRARKTKHIKYMQAWPFARPNADRAVFWLGPRKGRNSIIELAITNEENWGMPGQSYALDNQPLLISEVSQTAAMRTRIANSTATPDEIEAFQTTQAKKAAETTEEFRVLIDKLLDMRHQPLFICGLWAQHLLILDRARERGIKDNDFHPETVLFAGGGIKGTSLPANYREVVTAFYGDVIQIGTYGMTEMAQLCPRCEANCYHVPPALILLMLDATGERLLKPEEAVNGLLTGRVGFLDLMYEGRWGGLITGDKITMDITGKCACGRAGPVFLDTVARYVQAGEEDHIGCAGTIDAYVRGGLPT